MASGIYIRHTWEEHTGSADDKVSWLNHAETQYEEMIQYMTDYTHDFYTQSEANDRYARTPEHPNGRSDPDSLDAATVDGYTKSQILGAAFPVGAIVMFGSGTLPDNFEVCDGTNGNPNLQDYIPLGAGGGADPGDHGGSNEVYPSASSFTSPDTMLTDNQIPKHQHTYSDTRNYTSNLDTGSGWPRREPGSVLSRTTTTTEPGGISTRTVHNHAGCTLTWKGYLDEGDNYIEGALDIRPACRGVRFLVRA